MKGVAKLNDRDIIQFTFMPQSTHTHTHTPKKKKKKEIKYIKVQRPHKIKASRSRKTIPHALSSVESKDTLKIYASFLLHKTSLKKSTSKLSYENHKTGCLAIANHLL